MYGYIYVITDTINGKQYVGQHQYDKPELDPKYHGSGVIITNIYKKRPETILEELICCCDNLEELNTMEEYWVDELNTLSPNGYNLKTGGDRGVLTKESKEKIKNALLGSKYPENRINNVKNGLKEYYKTHTVWNKDIKMSEDACHNMSIAHINNPKQSKVVLQYSLDGNFIKEWPSTSEAQRQLKCKHINECCNGHRSSTGNFVWRYKESEDYPLKIKKTNKKELSKPRAVLQYDLSGNFIAEYSNANEAGKITGAANILKCCKGERTASNGFIWRYKE